MDNLHDQIINISKAAAFDIVSEHNKELKQQNDSLRVAINNVLNVISTNNVNEIIENPGNFIAKIGNICITSLKENRPL